MKQRLRGLWDRIRLLLVAVLTAAALLFALQNLHAVRIDVVVWQVEVSASLLVLGSFLIGLLVGAVTTFYYKGRFSLADWKRRRAVTAKAQAEERAVAAEGKAKALPAEAARETAQPKPQQESATKQEPSEERPPPGGRR
jgi:uncharacterized integral membrane protein